MPIMELKGSLVIIRRNISSRYSRYKPFIKLMYTIRVNREIKFLKLQDKHETYLE